MNPLYSTGNQNPHKYADGCVPQVDMVGNMTVSSGSVRDYQNSVDITLLEHVVVNPNEVGPNGLDNGTLETEKMYAVYVLADMAGRNKACAIISLNQERPIYPAKTKNIYNTHRLIGYVKSNIEGEGIPPLAPMTCVGQDRYRSVYFDMANPSLKILGDMTIYPDPSPVDLSSFVPSVREISAHLYGYATGEITEGQFVVYGTREQSVEGLIVGPSGAGVSSAASGNTTIPVSLIDGVPTMYIVCSSSALVTTLYCKGFDFSI